MTTTTPPLEFLLSEIHAIRHFISLSLNDEHFDADQTLDTVYLALRALPRLAARTDGRGGVVNSFIVGFAFGAVLALAVVFARALRKELWG